MPSPRNLEESVEAGVKRLNEQQDRLAGVNKMNQRQAPCRTTCECQPKMELLLLFGVSAAIAGALAYHVVSNLIQGAINSTYS